MPCHNSGTCITSGQTYICLCPDSYGGDHCEKPVSRKRPCDPSPCHHGSTCTVLPEGGYFCLCPPGKQGDRCQNGMGLARSSGKYNSTYVYDIYCCSLRSSAEDFFLIKLMSGVPILVKYTDLFLADTCVFTLSNETYSTQLATKYLSG